MLCSAEKVVSVTIKKYIEIPDEIDVLIRIYDRRNPNEKIDVDQVLYTALLEKLKDIKLENIKTAYCVACHKLKPGDEFYNQKDVQIYQRGYCKECTDHRRQLVYNRKLAGNWHKAIERTNGKCAICGDNFKDVHHITPRSLGGSDELENLVPLCRKCHTEAHNKCFHNANGINKEMYMKMKNAIG